MSRPPLVNKTSGNDELWNERNVTQAIVVFLFKLRTGNSNSMIAAILGLEREQQVSHFRRSVINCFEKDIVPSYFGFVTLPRKTLIENQTSLDAKTFYGITDQLALIMKIAMEDSSGLHTLLKPGDICIVHRGFRDVTSYLEERGNRVLMPALKGKRNQLSTGRIKCIPPL